MFHLKSFIFPFSTGTLPGLRLPASFPSRKHSWRSWQSCQLSTDCHLPSPHLWSQPPLPPTFSQLPTELPNGRLARSPSCPAGNTHAAPRSGTCRWILRAGIMKKGEPRCSMILETVARWRFPPRIWIIKKLGAPRF